METGDEPLVRGWNETVLREAAKAVRVRVVRVIASGAVPSFAVGDG